MYIEAYYRSVHTRRNHTDNDDCRRRRRRRSRNRQQIQFEIASIRHLQCTVQTYLRASKQFTANKEIRYDVK